MIVGIDAQLAVGTATGIGEYVRGLIDALKVEGVDVRELAQPRLDPWRFDRRIVWDQLLLPQRARASGAGILHCASGTMPLVLPMPAVVTVHDIAWVKVQSHAKAYARWYFGEFSRARYRAARAIAVDSVFSREELLSVLDIPPERVHVVYPGVAADFCRLDRAPESDARTVLVPGTVERRKNLEVLIRALPALAPGVRIVSVGPHTPYSARCRVLAAELGVSERLELRGYVPRKEVLDLYARASVVAVPSHYEGFGYAAAQALCAGVPLVVSDRAALPEVAGGDARVVQADDPVQWAIAVAECIAGVRVASARPRAIARFSWAASARAMRRVYETV